MLGDVVKQYRAARGWKQKDLARQAGIGQSHVSMIERNRVPLPNTSTLGALARAFGITLDDLVAAAGLEAPPVDLLPDPTIADWLDDLAAIGPTLSQTERAALLDHARALRDRRG